MKHLPLWLTLLIAACATTSPEPVEYLLRPPLEETVSTRLQPPFAALVGLEIAPYLDRNGIVVETGDRRIQVAQNHRWAEPLTQSLRHLLAVEITRASGRSVADLRTASREHQVSIHVDIDRLHGSLQGRVVLDAEWQLREPRTGRVLGRYELARSTRTRADGYDGLVAAHVELIRQLAGAIAETLLTDS